MEGNLQTLVKITARFDPVNNTGGGATGNPGTNQPKTPSEIIQDLNSVEHFSVVRLEGQDGLSELFDYQVEAMVSRAWYTNLVQSGNNLESELLGLSLGIRLEKDVSRTGDKKTYQRLIHGEIWDTSTLVNAGARWTMCFRLRPALARLELSKRTRAWTGVETTKIIREIIEPLYPRRFELPGDVPPSGADDYNQAVTRPLVIQYQETDLAFFLRLCSRHGIAFYTTTVEDKHGIALTTDASTIALNLEPEMTMVTFDSDPTDLNSMFLKSWRRQAKNMENPVSLLDSSYRAYGSSPVGYVEAKSQEQSAWQEDGASTAHYLDTREGEVTRSNVEDLLGRTGKALAIARDSRKLVVKSETTCFNLAPGADFQVQPKTNQDIPESLFHWGGQDARSRVLRQRLLFSQDKNGSRVECTLVLVPSGSHQLPWPPPPQARIHGVLTARVVGGPPNQPTLDDHTVSDEPSALGRVMVRLHCDRGWSGELSDKGYWARVAQTMAGPNYGAMFWPRVGNEVLLAFENGDPDRPVVVGSLYNSANLPPYTLPAAKYIQGWKSRCADADSDATRFNVIVLGDESGDAGVVLRSSGAIYVANHGERNVLGPGSFDVS